MTTLKYKDYQGSVSFEDGTLLIQILHIDDFVTTECDSASGAQKAFEALVEDYLETCKAANKEPSRPFKGTFNVRVSPSLHRSIAMAAIDANETMNAWIANALQEKIDRQKSARRIFDPQYISKMTEGVTSHYVAIANFAIANRPVMERSSYGQRMGLRLERSSIRPFLQEEDDDNYSRRSSI